MSDTLRYSDSITVFAAAYVALQAELPKIPKEKTGQAGNQKTKYADLETTIELVKPLLAKHGFSFLQPCSGGAGGYVSVTTILLHKSGEWVRDTLSMPTGNNGAQGVGSAISYGKRYALTSLLGLATEDDDGAGASKANRTAATAITPAQLTAMGAAFTEIGITDRSERLAFVVAAIDRHVESSKELTKPEAARVFDEINVRKNRNAA